MNIRLCTYRIDCAIRYLKCTDEALESVEERSILPRALFVSQLVRNELAQRNGTFASYSDQQLKCILSQSRHATMHASVSIQRETGTPMSPRGRR